MQIDNIVKKVLLKYPILGNIIANLEFQYTTENVPAPAFTDGKTLYYKDEFFKEFTESEQKFIVAHEIFHILFRHLNRNLGKDPDLLNYVEDAIINQMLIRDGLSMPEGLVFEKDALDYSVEELYLKLLPRLDEIKSWMGENTYHLDLTEEEKEAIAHEIKSKIEEIKSKLDEILDNSYSKYKNNFQELMEDNKVLREELMKDFSEELKQRAFGSRAGNEKLKAEKVGKARPLLYWQELLRKSIIVPEQTTTSFYEIEPDGIIKKEERPDECFAESEIIIDSSGSMSIELIKAILRECKNILKTSYIKVGFCDTKFYGWQTINNENDIDKLNIQGRGGTNFQVMVDTFSKKAENKIILTDGFCTFPKNDKDVLWIIINYYSYRETKNEPCSNKIYINEDDIPVPQNQKRYVLKNNLGLRI